MEAEDLSLRVASFSCYLNPEDSFVQKIWAGSSNVKISKANAAAAVADGRRRVNNNNNFTFNVASSRPVQDPTVAFILPHQHNIINPTTTHRNNHPKPSKNYFNSTTSDYHATVPGGIKYTNLQAFKSATPSVSSEASSLSSQMALLPSIIKHNKKGSIGRRLFLGFGCRGRPCSDDKDVFVSQQAKGVENQHFATNCENSTGEPRKSLEVFGADKIINKKGGVAGNLERKLSMLTWDAIPNNNAQNKPPANNTTISDDRVSDASSDLFEIEDISSSTGGGYGYVASQTTAVDYTSGCSSPTTQYAPSEASIQWSVVTASAADYAASVVSDYYCDEKCNSIAGHDTIIRGAAKAKNIAMAKSSPKSGRSGGLLGCNSLKAVSVAESMAKTGDHQLPKLGNHAAQLSFARNV